MSRPIDEKIVKMSLDNQDFTRKANSTMSIFAKLQQKFGSAKNLNLSGTTKSLNDVSGAANKISLKSLITGAAGVGSSFTAMGAIAVGALMKIGSSAVTAGARLLKSFTLDPITSGFSEYEEKMNAIQVILSNTEGKSNLDDVKASLADLNTYADKTIYTFADMTKNMGTFTAAGVDLKTAQTAIKGIGNLAAVSGSNKQQAGTAMYQLSQAIAAGKVGLQDWNSVVNAGMGGAKFQNALKNNAKGFWDNADASLSFRDSLQEGWLTTEVLMKTLQEFSEDQSMLEAATKVRTFSQLVDTAREALQSGWATTWELIFGDFKESGDMWTEVGNAILQPIEKSANERNKLISDFNQLGGRAAVVTTIKNAFNGLVQVFGIVKTAFREVFPPATAEQLANIAKRIAELSKGFKLSGDSANQLKNIFKGVFSIFSIGISLAKSVGNAIKNVIPKSAGGDILDLIEKIALMITKFAESLKAGNAFTKTMDSISQGVGKVAQGIWNFAGTITDFIGDMAKGAVKLVSVVGPAFQKVGTFVKDMLKSLNVRDVGNVGVIASLLIAVKKLDKVRDTFKGFLDNFSGLFGSIKGGIENLGGLKDVLEDLQTAIKAGTLTQIAIAVGLLAGSLKLLSTIDGSDMAKSLEAMGVTLLALVGTLKLVSKIDMAGMSSMKAATTLLALGASVLVLAGALKVFASIKPEELGRGMLALVGTVGTLVVAMTVLSKFSGKIATSGGSMIALAASVVILSGAVKMLSKIKGDDLAKSIISLAGIFASLAGFLKVVNGAKFGPGQATGVVILAGAILIMVQGIKQIASIDVNSIVKGLVTIGLILTEVAIFVKVASGSKVMGAATGMVLVAAAINMLVGPIKQLGSMDIKTLAVGLGAMAIALVEVVAAMKFATGGLAGAAAILVVANAVKVLVPPLLALTKLTLAQAATGLITLGVALGIMAAAGAVANAIAPGLIVLSIAIGAVSVAAVAIAATITAFTTALGFLATVGVAGIQAVVNSLSQLLTGLTGLIPQMVTFGVTAITSLAGGLATAAPQLAVSALQLILGFLQALSTYVPQIATVGMELITGLMNALADNLPQLIDAGINLIVQLMNGMANGVRDNQEQLVGAMLNVVEAMLEAMVTGLQAILEVMFGWIPGFSGAAGKMGDAAKAALRDTFSTAATGQIGSNSGQSFVNGVNGTQGNAGNAGKNVGNSAKNGVNGITGQFTTVGGTAGSLYTNALNGQSGNARGAGTNVGNSARGGAGSVSLTGTGANAGGQYTNGVSSRSGSARGAGSSIGNSARGGAGSVSLTGTGSNAGSGFAGGVRGQSGAAGGAGASLANAARGSAQLDLSGAGSNAGAGFANGIQSWAGRAASAAASLASSAMAAVKRALDSHSPSRKMHEIGTWFGQGFSNGISAETTNVESSSKSLAMRAVETATEYAQLVADAINDKLSLQPVITPILDTSMMQMPDLTTRIGWNPNDGGTPHGDISITVNAPSGDPTAIANEVEKIIVRRIQS